MLKLREKRSLIVAIAIPYKIHNICIYNPDYCFFLCAIERIFLSHE